MILSGLVKEAGLKFWLFPSRDSYSVKTSNHTKVFFHLKFNICIKLEHQWQFLPNVLILSKKKTKKYISFKCWFWISKISVSLLSSLSNKHTFLYIFKYKCFDIWLWTGLPGRKLIQTNKASESFERKSRALTSQV